MKYIRIISQSSEWKRYIIWMGNVRQRGVSKGTDVARNFRQGVRQSVAFLLSIRVQLPYA